jgi:ABC-type Zn uptake system ZnuABC Zn-binding protein ZnuA
MRNTIVSQFMIFSLGLLLTACSLLGTIGDDVRSIEELDALWAEPSDLQPAELLEGERLKVVATTTIVGDVVAFIGGNDIELTVLMPFNIDPHSFEPTTSDLRAMSEADVIFINGLGLELPLYDFLESVIDEVAVISLSEGISIREVEPSSGDGEGEPSAGGIDPHVWFDPANVKHWAERIDHALSILAPSRRSKLNEHTDTYTKFLDGLDEWIEESVSQVPEEKRIIVSDHYVFGYFTQRYGFESVGAVVPVYSSAAEPSAQEIANLEETISELGVSAVFVGESSSSAAADSLAEDTGVQLIKLYTGSLSDPDGPATSYLNMMQYNVNQIVNALME